MQNVTYTVEGQKLVITVDLSQRLGPSASGKTTLVASTSGNATLPGASGIKFGLNVFTPNR
jgi:ABC-type hemin transport system ATPase subunit